MTDVDAGDPGPLPPADDLPEDVPLEVLDRLELERLDENHPPVATNGHRPHTNGTGGGRPPPHNLDAEQAVLAACLLNSQAIVDALDVGLDHQAFYKPAHAHIWAAITELADAGTPVDPVTVADHLERAGHLDNIGGRWAIIDIESAAPATSNAAHYARIILDRARMRRLIGLGSEITQLGYDIPDDVDQAETAARALLEHAVDDQTNTSWAPVDLAQVLDGTIDIPEPTVLTRDDGQGLIYPGRVHAFNAESETGKSWLAQHAAVQEIDAGNHVVYLDFEDDAGGIVERLVALGLTPDQITSRFTYIRPDDPLDAAAWAHLDRVIAEHQPSLVVLDGVTEAMVQNGWSIIDNDDIARFLTALPRRIARAGPAVVMIDHVVKNKDNRGADAIGGQHKRAGVSGATYRLDPIRPFGRGLHGQATITVTKDRPGRVRGASRGGKQAGVFHLEPTADGGVTAHVAAQPLDTTPASTGGHDVVPTGLMDKVSRFVENSNTAGIHPSGKDIEDNVVGRAKWIRIAVTELLAGGHLERDHRSHYTSIVPFREDGDPGPDEPAQPTETVEQPALDDPPDPWDEEF